MADQRSDRTRTPPQGYTSPWSLVASGLVLAVVGGVVLAWGIEAGFALVVVGGALVQVAIIAFGVSIGYLRGKELEARSRR